MPTIDQYSLVPLPLSLLANDHEIATATGFFYERDGETYIVTNWHVLSARNPYTGQPNNKHAAVPDKVHVKLHLRDRPGHFHGAHIELSNQSGEAAWFQHPQGQAIDVAVLKISKFPARVAVYAAVRPDEMPNLAFYIGVDVFVLGYPLGITFQGILPVWKRATITSEPELPADDLPQFLVDTSTRQGMSGAPVIVRTSGYAPRDDGTTGLGQGTFIRFIGVYSGRYGAEDELAAQLGRVWHKSVIDEVIEARAPGTYELRR